MLRLWHRRRVQLLGLPIEGIGQLARDFVVVHAASRGLVLVPLQDLEVVLVEARSQIVALPARGVSVDLNVPLIMILIVLLLAEGLLLLRGRGEVLWLEQQVGVGARIRGLELTLCKL